MTKFSRMFDFLKKEKVISLVSVLAIFVSFTLLSFIITFLVFSNTAMSYLQKQVQVMVFFKDSFGSENILEIKNQLESDTRISEVRYISKEDALNIFREVNKDEPTLQEALSSNILPASLEIKTYNISDLDVIYDEFKEKEYVEEVRYLKDIKDRFQYYSLIITGVSLIITLLFFIVSFGIIISTIRINIFQKKDEIEIMKLVGASDDFVQKPFIYQGVLYALLGSFLAGLVFTILLLAIYFTNFLGFRDINYLTIYGNFQIHFLLYILLLVILINLTGYLLGRIGSKAAIKNYLKV